MGMHYERKIFMGKILDEILASAQPKEAYYESVLAKKATDDKKVKKRGLGKIVRALDTGKPEKKIQKEIIDMLKEMGVFHRRIEGSGKITHTGKDSATLTSSSQKGMSDVVACIKGWFVAIEIKKPKGLVDPFQANFLTGLMEAGGKAIIATDANRLKELLETGKVTDYFEWYDKKIAVA